MAPFKYKYLNGRLTALLFIGINPVQSRKRLRDDG